MFVLKENKYRSKNAIILFMKAVAKDEERMSIANISLLLNNLQLLNGHSYHFSHLFPYITLINAFTFFVSNKNARKQITNEKSIR